MLLEYQKLNFFIISDLYLPGYTLVRADHQSNTKKFGVCIYFQEFPAFKNIRYRD